MRPSPAEEAALEYAERGWALLPVKPGTKLPHSELLPKDRTGKPSWKPLAERAASDAEIRDWFAWDPEANLGVICGEPSNGLVVLDFDRESEEALELPKTVEASTSRGRHVYLQTEEPIKTRKLEWGEMKGEGGYVVIPPSVHASGAPYGWEEGLSPAEVDVADLPNDLLMLPKSKQVTRDLVTCLPSVTCLPGHGDKTVDRQSVPNSLIEKGDWLRDFFRDEAAALRAARTMGIPDGIGLGTTFHCVIPGHTERSPSASLYPNSTGVIIYRDWHGATSGRMVYTLPEVRAARAYGCPVTLSRPEHAVWGLRLLVEAGVLKPEHVDAPKLRHDAPAVLRRIYDGFLLLLGVRWIYEYGAPAPFTWRFAEAWCGVSQRHAGKAIQELLKGDLLTQVGEHRRTALFLPGSARRN